MVLQNLFKPVFIFYRYVMGSVAQDDRVISLISISGLQNILNNLQDQLTRCQKALNAFLEVFIIYMRIKLLKLLLFY